MPFLDLFYRLGRKIGLIPVGIIEVHVLHEPAGKQSIGELFIPLELRGAAVSTTSDRIPAQVYGKADPDCVHYLYRSGQVLRGEIDVLMQINEAVFRAPGVRIRVQRAGMDRSDSEEEEYERKVT